MIPVLGDIWPGNHSARISAFAGKLGKYAFFAYFGQAVFYSFDKIIYSLNIGVYVKALILHLTIPLFSLILYLLTKWIRKSIKKKAV